ncbi:GNAT family N-acetyltransferase [Corynebacterium sp. HS2168-gen11]|uniref:GNAT family N-acetyltransferase n=1 Tax=Corynebacterium sp. HS2168-gen11 TaxID=2974027 RepID=UPI00216B3FFB|nr:GNAT family N-acetyltransferase [Corynebacterium sp. HS2168-gen11]MCS4536154.1 GNAT family N-acetyltransferase [Corynebacterium sp. HS2168-gen11]
MLESPTLQLRQWHHDDAEYLFEYAKDPDIGPRAGWPVHESLQASRDIITNVLQQPHCFAIVPREVGHVIGSVGLTLHPASPYTTADDECALGYWIAKPFWGKGYAVATSQLILDYARDQLHMRRVWSAHYVGNEQSHRVQTKLGFRFSHTIENMPHPLINEQTDTNVLVYDFSSNEA